MFLDAVSLTRTVCVSSHRSVINRAYAALDNATKGGIVAALAHDPVLRNATRFALKLTEHTCARALPSLLEMYSLSVF